VVLGQLTPFKPTSPESIPFGSAVQDDPPVVVKKAFLDPPTATQKDELSTQLTLFR
jgi:hypothetical protein